MCLVKLFSPLTFCTWGQLSLCAPFRYTTARRRHLQPTPSPHRTTITDLIVSLTHIASTARGLLLQTSWRSVCVGHTDELYKNGWTDRDAVQSGPKEVRRLCIRRDRGIHNAMAPPGKYDGIIGAAAMRAGATITETNCFRNHSYTLVTYCMYHFMYNLIACSLNVIKHS